MRLYGLRTTAIVSVALLVNWVSSGCAFLPALPVQQHQHVPWRENVAGLAMRVGPRHSRKVGFMPGHRRLRHKLLDMLSMCSEGRNSAEEVVVTPPQEESEYAFRLAHPTNAPQHALLQSLACEGTRCIQPRHSQQKYMEKLMHFLIRTVL
jgi:hypothetical protein